MRHLIFILLISLFSQNIFSQVPFSLTSGSSINANELNNNFEHFNKKYLEYSLPSIINGKDSGVGYAHNLYSFFLKPNKTYKFIFEYDISLVSQDGFAIRVCQGHAQPSTSESSTANPACYIVSSGTTLPTIVNLGGNAGTSSVNTGLNIVNGPKIIKTPNLGSNIEYTLQIISLSDDTLLRKLIMTVIEDNSLIKVNSLVD